MTQEIPRIVLITGGGNGIGRSIALKFAEIGARVYIAGRRHGAMLDTAREVEQAGGFCTVIPADVTRRDHALKVYEAIEEKEGHLDLLINAAGVFAMGLVHETSEEEFDSLFASNVKGLWIMSKYAIPLLRKSKTPNIINISSIAGSRTDAGMGVYEASKAAVNTLTKVMARELASEKIRVNAIAPGPMDTELFTASILGDDKELHHEKREEYMQSVPFGRLGNPDEVARLAVFLASPESDFISGSITSIDGAMGY